VAESGQPAILHPLCSILQPLSCIILLCGLLTLGGCSSAVNAGQNAALGGDDLVKMTDDMAMQIAADPQVRDAVAARGALKVVVMPVENLMRAEVLPSGAKEAFTARVRTLLSRHAPGEFIWIMNRDTYQALRNRELAGAVGNVDLGPSPDAVQPEYALTSRFTSLADETRRGRTSYYVCAYELTDLADRTVLWRGSYEVKKVAVRGFLD
jgi:hypothetical protein